MNLFLIGYRGVGKTTVAQLLGQILGWNWTDADQEIQRGSGKTIREIFQKDGEAEFRRLESETILRLAAGDSCVVALGGGAVVSQENRDAIAGRGKVIWLTATAETIHSRLSADAATAQQRPNLTAAGGLREITRLLASREPIYRQSADYQVDTEGKSPADVAQAIDQWLREEERDREKGR